MPFRECADGLYSPLCYLTAKVVEEVIIACMNAAAFSALIFWSVKLAGSFVIFFLVNCVMSNIGIGENLS